MITVVSGLPRSGTSLMMQMLAAGGLPALSDGTRAPDEDNPRGYHEWETAKQLPQRPGLIDEARGKAVKVISALLTALPVDRPYRIVFMRRPLPEVLASQAAMIRRRGTDGPAVPAPALAAAMEAHLRQVTMWLTRQPAMDVAWVAYHDVLARPLEEATRIRHFLGLPLDVQAMATQVEPVLYRQRRGRTTVNAADTLSAAETVR